MDDDDISDARRVLLPKAVKNEPAETDGYEVVAPTTTRPVATPVRAAEKTVKGEPCPNENKPNDELVVPPCKANKYAKDLTRQEP